MDSSVGKRAEKFLKEKSRRRYWITAVSILGVFVVIGTALALMAPARALNDVFCGMKEHEHNEECYEAVLICGYDDEAEGLSGTAAEGETSVATVHVHDENCYKTEEKLICGREETEGHIHTPECYTQEDTITCGREESEGHTHTEECYGEDGGLICGQEESEGHTHTAECHTVQDVLTCGQEESEGHTHTEDCYEETKTLVCGNGTGTDIGNGEEQQETSAAHVHTEECYEYNLICELEEHKHTDACRVEPVFYCENDLHVHTDNCLDENGQPICGYADFEVHTHGKGCIGEKGTVACHRPEIEAHAHTNECYRQNAETGELELVCGKPEIILHTHEGDCFDEQGRLICDRWEIREHVHGDECLVPPEARSEVRTVQYFEGDGFIVSVEYGERADIPRKAVLLAEQITEESDAEHYAQRAAEYENIVGEESAPMQALLKIGFYMGTKEVEPKEPVVVTVQLLDENGMAEGEPITVIHFAEEGAEQLDGSDAQNGSTTFEIGSFSEIAIGFVNKDKDKAENNSSFYCVEKIHTHTNNCMDGNGEAICGFSDFVVHVHNDLCYDADNNLICPLPETTVHVHGEDCYGEAAEDGEPQLICRQEGITLHTHGEECYDEDGYLICDKQEVLEHVHSEECFIEPEEQEKAEISQTFQGDGFTITATYGEDADIPVKARLTVEQITAESDAEAYAAREAKYAELAGADAAPMRALLKIGFCIGEKEIIPAEPVKVTVQFTGENGMKEGTSVVIVCFRNENAELFEGGMVGDNGVAFSMASCSEIAFGYEVEDKRAKVVVNKSYEYENDLFTAVFKVEGKVPIPDDLLDGGLPQEDAGTSDGQNAADAGAQETDEAGLKQQIAVSDEPPQNSDNGQPGNETAGNLTAEGLEDDVASDADIAGNEVEENTALLTEDELAGKLEFKAEPLDETTEEYKIAAAAYGEETEEEKDLYLNQVLSYYLTYNDVKLDLTDCKVTMEITPTQKLVDYAEETVATSPEGDVDIQAEVTISVIDISDMANTEAVEGTDSKGSDSDDAVLSGIAEADQADAGMAVADMYTEDANSIADAEKQENGIEGNRTFATEVIAAEPVTQEFMTKPMNVTLKAKGTDNSVATRVESQANPRFTVQFYAYIDKLDTRETAGTNSQNDGWLPVIDTSGKVLPQNGANVKRRFIHVVNNNVQTKNELTEIYSQGEYEYILAPGLVYFNKIAKNDNYELQEIQVLRSGSTEWEKYSCRNGKEWHFTNKQETKDNNENDFIMITANATIRLVHTVKTDSVVNGAEFYDYDISDGSVYDSNRVAQDRGIATTHDDAPVWYMYTNRQGINSNIENQTFGFGNNNMSTTMGEIPGNMANGVNADCGKATFGLVTGLSEGKVQYAGNVIAPNLFNDGDAVGKTSYAGNLLFSQKGDTYTLTGAEVKNKEGNVVSGVSNLDKFNRQQFNWNKSYYFAANDFYPMDDVETAGVGGHDLKFGSSAGYNFDGGKGALRSFSDPNSVQKAGRVPISDDGLNHNHYFGMHYTVEFDLVKDYVGPLEYLFYGDDDMWVFLEGPRYTGQLICDIGGVHSSIGEYVNLWDYISKGTEGHYKLSFFYTERGASGSTCWMQFTLPSVSFATTTQDTGQIRIEKQVTGNTTSEEFGFEVEFKDASGNALMNDYSYTKYDSKTNAVIENDILIWNNAKFTLKAGEYIVVSFLPEGATYTIKEVGPVTVNPKQPGEDLSWTVDPNNPYIPEITNNQGISSNNGQISGGVTKDTMVQIKYNNIQQYELPETGGNGLNLYTIAGTLCTMLGAGLLYRKKFRERRGEGV